MWVVPIFLDGQNLLTPPIPVLLGIGGDPFLCNVLTVVVTSTWRQPLEARE